MRGILAAAGAASIAAVSAAAPQGVTLAANVLTVTGYTFGGTIEWDMDDIFGGTYCSESSGNVCSPVRYLSGLPVGGEADGLRALRTAISQTAPPTTVIGFSQGATISTHWIRENAGTADAPTPTELSFVLAANPLRKYGGVRSQLGFDAPTPESEYSVLDIAIEYDGAADFPDNPFNLLAVANALAGFQYVHIFGYQDIDLDTAEKLVWTEGNTTYVLVRRENLPLLEPLRLLGLTELADSLNGPLKEIIDSAYDRDYPGLVDTADQDRAIADALTAGADEDTSSLMARTASERSTAYGDDATESASTVTDDAPSSDDTTDVEPDDPGAGDTDSDDGAGADSTDDGADDDAGDEGAEDDESGAESAPTEDTEGSDTDSDSQTDSAGDSDPDRGAGTASGSAGDAQ